MSYDRNNQDVHAVIASGSLHTVYDLPPSCLLLIWNGNIYTCDYLIMSLLTTDVTADNTGPINVVQLLDTLNLKGAFTINQGG